MLRDVVDGDLPIFFAHQSDRGSNEMAGVPPRPREDFEAHWKKIRADVSCVLQTVTFGEEVAGYFGSFVRDGKREVCYWLGREFWGKGVASAGLKQFLAGYAERPLYAVVSKDNAASIRVLEKNGFRLLKEELFTNREGKKELVYLFLLSVSGAARPR